MINGFWDNRETSVRKMDVTLKSLEIVYLVRTQNVPKMQHFLPSDTHTVRVRICGKTYFLENFANVLNK